MPLRRPVVPTARSYSIPAPVGGINTVSAGLQLPPSDCASAVNLISAENGLRTRLGWLEWATDLVGASTPEVRTVMPFSGSQRSSDRLFAATDGFIFDVSGGGSSISPSLAFADTTPGAGYGISAAMTTTAGHFLLYCDEMNGAHLYAESGATWTALSEGSGPGQIDGVDPRRLVFVAVFKNRLWFVERDSSDAWYLPVGQVTGTATRFPLGTMLREGGSIVGLWNWTYDGGAGVDDSLVVVSSGGDVLVYQGTDPSSASTFALRGVWQIGFPPSGRRIASTYGGDLLLLSRQGLVPISRLVVGAAGDVEYATAKISNLINRLMYERATSKDWGVVLQPEDNALVVLVPRGSSGREFQLAQALASKGWFPYQGMPMLCANVWQGRLYFGTEDGRVCAHTGSVEQLLLDRTTFGPIEWSLLTASSNLGTPTQKQVQLLRPLLLTDTGIPSVEVEARYGYSQAAIDPVDVVLGSGDDVWDEGVWDVMLWSGAPEPSIVTRGATGVGAEVAVAVRGSSIGRTVLVGIDVTFTSGGFL